MSATGRGSERNEDDFYATPAWCVRRLLEKVKFPAGRWLEPGAGSGAIIRAAEPLKIGPILWMGVDLHQAPGDLWVDWFAGDFLSDAMLIRLAEYTKGGGFDVAIGNPPYKLAQAFADRCFQLASQTALLLRLNFLGSEERAEWWEKHPADVYVLPNRPSFSWACKCTGCGKKWSGAPASATALHACLFDGKVKVTKTDATEYAWFVWGEGGTVGKRDPRHYHLALTPESERYTRAPSPQEKHP